MIGFITYGATLVFYAALFPRLARNTAHARRLRDRYEQGDISVEEYEREESLEKNRISNISTVSTAVETCGRGAELSCAGTQQHRVHHHAGPEPLNPATSCGRPEGQQLRAGLVSIDISPGCARLADTHLRQDKRILGATGHLVVYAPDLSSVYFLGCTDPAS